MKSFIVRDLKNNPLEALRQAREGLVVAMNPDKTHALLAHLHEEKLLEMPGVRLALAVKGLVGRIALRLGRRQRAQKRQGAACEDRAECHRLNAAYD